MNRTYDLGLLTFQDRFRIAANVVLIVLRARDERKENKNLPVDFQFSQANVEGLAPATGSVPPIQVEVSDYPQTSTGGG